MALVVFAAREGLKRISITKRQTTLLSETAGHTKYSKKILSLH